MSSSASPGPPALDLSRVAKLYGRTAALRAMSLRLESSQILALLGPNGSGKTTLLKIIAGATAPTLGAGSILGRDLLRDRASLRSEVGLLAAETYLYDDLTALENLRFIVTMAGRRPAAPEIGDALERVGLVAHTSERVRTFSSGMRRRLCLARLLLLRPSLLLLDEPYNSLDEAAADLVDEIVREAAGDGRTVILATHDAERALALAHLVVTLERGTLTYFGPAGNRRETHAQHVG